MATTKKKATKGAKAVTKKAARKPAKAKAPAKRPAHRAAAKRADGGNAYPFTTKAQLLARLESEDTFVVEALRVLQARTVRRVAGESSGFMSSQVHRGARLHASIRDGGKLTPTELADARKLLPLYVSQLARHYRALHIKSSPALAKVAELFGVRP